MFAFRTALFIIITRELPFPDLNTIDKDEIYRRFKEYKFPPLGKLLGRDIIRNY
jgi:hypothetical protein